MMNQHSVVLGEWGSNKTLTNRSTQRPLTSVGPGTRKRRRSNDVDGEERGKKIVAGGSGFGSGSGSGSGAATVDSGVK